VIDGRKLACIVAAALVVTRFAAADDANTLTLMTFNIRVGIPTGHGFGKYIVTEDDLRRIADVITSAGADVVGMQEVDCEFGLTLPPQRRRSSAMNEPRLLAHFCSMHYAFGSALDDIKYPSDNAEYVEWGTPEQWTNNGGRHGEVGNCILLRSGMAGKPANLALPGFRTRNAAPAFLQSLPALTVRR
jgi:endonuclease/exonuclease/phosphatase family metal-dependent hydrolase